MGTFSKCYSQFYEPQRLLQFWWQFFRGTCDVISNDFYNATDCLGIKQVEFLGGCRILKSHEFEVSNYRFRYSLQKLFYKRLLKMTICAPFLLEN